MDGGAPNPVETGKWTHGLFGCFDNLGVCIVAYFVPCVTFGQTKQRLTGDGCVLYGLLYLVPILNCVLQTQQRGEIRQRRAIPGGGFGDFCTVFCCACCALIQEEQEAIHLQSQAPVTGVMVTNQTTSTATVVIGGNNPTMYPPGPPAGEQQPPPYNMGYNTTPQYNMPPGEYNAPPAEYNMPPKEIKEMDMNRV